MHLPDMPKDAFFCLCFPPLALSKSGTVEDQSSSQPVTPAPVRIMYSCIWFCIVTVTKICKLFTH